jgi:hypothetical protein
LTEGWACAIAGRRARQVTIALVVLQIGGCAVDLGSEQHALMPLFCLVSPSLAVEILGSILGLTLALSWVVGLLAIRFAMLRPPTGCCSRRCRSRGQSILTCWEAAC